MSIQRLAVSAALAMALAPAAQATASLTRSHSVYADTRHCCWDAPFNMDRASGSDATYSAASWGSQASINGSLGYGLIMGAASAATDITHYVYGTAIGEARDYWVDSFQIHSTTLATGTPVVLSLGVLLDASVNTSALGQGYVLAVIGTGLDAGWLAGVDTRVVGSGQHGSTATLETHVGSTVTLVGQMNTRAWAELSNGPVKVATSQVSGSARFTVQSLTDGAFYSSTSSIHYVVPAPVPEPGTWAMLLAGGAMLALALRFRRADTRPA